MQSVSHASYTLRILRRALVVVVTCAANGQAEQLAEIPVLGAIQSNDRGVVEMALVQWDQSGTPDPLELRWNTGHKNALRGIRDDVTFVNDSVQAFEIALKVAVERTPAHRHTGTLSILGLAYRATRSDGPSAGGVFTVGFIAALKGERIRKNVAMTGTIEPDGSIGPVGAIPDKLRAAAREGYRTVLIPRGQLYEPRWNLPALASSLNLSVLEVSTIEDAYELMTGLRL